MQFRDKLRHTLENGISNVLSNDFNDVLTKENAVKHLQELTEEWNGIFIACHSPTRFWIDSTDENKHAVVFGELESKTLILGPDHVKKAISTPIILFFEDQAIKMEMSDETVRTIETTGHLKDIAYNEMFKHVTAKRNIAQLCAGHEKAEEDFFRRP